MEEVHQSCYQDHTDWKKY